MITRRLALLWAAVAVAAPAPAVAGRLFGRSTNSPPPPAPSPPAAPGNGSVPYSPTQLIATGSTGGQKTFTWRAPRWFEDGVAITGDITYTVRVATASGGAVIGGSLAGSATVVNALTVNVTGLPASVLYATVTATHTQGESKESEQITWTGT